MDQFSRSTLLYGEDAMQQLYRSSVAIFGIGGVGGYVAEALARMGIGTLHLFDNDVVSLTNLNRQIIATHETIGQAKVAIMKDRIHAINPKANVIVHNLFVLPENLNQINFNDFDYIVDAIDTITTKISLIQRAHAVQKPIISSMGAGNKLDPSKIRVADIYQTSVCPLAKVMRYELKRRQIPALKVIYSLENPHTVDPQTEQESLQESLNNGSKRRHIPGSNAVIPAMFGLWIAHEVIQDLIVTKSTDK